MTDSTKLELSFTTKQISYLSHTSCASFVEDQPGRFGIHDSPENESLMGSGFLHWLENDSYLAALVMQQACIARGFHASILVDDNDEDKNEWVVWTDDPLFFVRNDLIGVKKMIDDDPEYEKYVYWNDIGGFPFDDMSPEAQAAFEKLIDLHHLVEPLNREMDVYRSIIEGNVNA